MNPILQNLFKLSSVNIFHNDRTNKKLWLTYFFWYPT